MIGTAPVDAPVDRNDEIAKSSTEVANTTIRLAKIAGPSWGSSTIRSAWVRVAPRSRAASSNCNAPETTYVADFLGLANLLLAVVSTEGEVEVLGRTVPATTDGVRGPCTAFARPERLGLGDPSDADVTGVVLDVVFVGSTTHVRVVVADQELEVVLSNDGASWVPTPGSRVGVVLPAEALRILER